MVRYIISWVEIASLRNPEINILLPGSNFGCEARYSEVSAAFSRQIWKQCLKICNDRCLAHPFHFIISSLTANANNVGPLRWELLKKSRIYHHQCLATTVVPRKDSNSRTSWSFEKPLKLQRSVATVGWYSNREFNLCRVVSSFPPVLMILTGQAGPWIKLK
jgi:hypothetical protein